MKCFVLGSLSSIGLYPVVVALND